MYYYLVHWLLAYVQKKIGDDMGVKPGAEMLSAIEEAEASGARVALIDRDIQVTLQRFWGRRITSYNVCYTKLLRGAKNNFQKAIFRF